MSAPADSGSLLDARFAAQKIAFGPLLFQAARLLRDLGILKTLREARAGLALDEITRRVDVPRYGVLVLLEAGLAAGMVRREGERYALTTTGAVVLTDDLTRVNMDFVQHCCYRAMYHLEEAVREGRPAGLQEVFGDWATIYPAVPALPEPARGSWYRWDHYFSDAAFPQALPIVFERRPRRVLDVGGNTGKWAVECCRHDRDVTVTLLDLPEVAELARRHVEEAGLSGRITVQPIDLLDHRQPFPAGHDAIWMSQFLVCFSEADVARLLERAAAALGAESRLYILDTFWDRQEFPASTYCLQAISLYFTCLANGCSRMYKASDIEALAVAAGLEIEGISDGLGLCSSLMVCRRK